MSDDAITADEIARLRTIAEDPLIAPSKRIKARTILKALARAQEEAHDTDLRRLLAAKIRTGQALSWRERTQARNLKLLAKRGDG